MALGERDLCPLQWFDYFYYLCIELIIIEMKDKILELRSRGHSYNQIVKKLGCSKGTVSYYCGAGQKKKSLDRQRKNRLINSGTIISKKLNDLFKYKSRNFRRDGKRIGLVDRTFKSADLIKKIGKYPACYLTGRDIDLYNTKSYQLDHVAPRSRGGDNSLDNVGITVAEANIAKGSMTVNEFLSFCVEVLEHNGYSVIKT